MILTIAMLFQQTAYSQCNVLVWSDEFNYTGLPDPEKWSFETGGGGWGNNELQYYRDGTNNAEVVDGNLVITARKESYGGRDYTSARLITLHTGNFWQYGKIEARIKLPYGQGIWPAFWMLGKNFGAVGWPACGEIDIMEKIGGGTNESTVYGTAHWDHNGSYASYGGQVILSSGIFADAFHVFSIEWDSQRIKWFLDGKEYHVMDITPQALSEFHNEFFIILNVAVGGNWPGSPDLTTVFPQTMEVDYVRVYSSPDYLEMKGPDEVVPGQTDLTYELPYDEQASYSWTVPEGTT
ncbi:MAG: glycoside hydrolase family 16 protein, partial [Bacteroidales bacterium]